MPIREIENKILEEAGAEAGRIKEQNDITLRELAQEHEWKKETLREDILLEAGKMAEEARKSFLIPARLKARRVILEEKQKILEELYGEIQKEKRLKKAEIIKIREETEVKVSHLLFGQ